MAKRGRGAGLWILATVVLLAVAWVTLPSWGQAKQQASNPFHQLHFRWVGPIGNRVTIAIGDPGNPKVMYAGAASGGIWKTTDGGWNWKPIFDHQDVAAIGDLAMAPSQHNILWAGTGEAFLIRPEHPMGDGVYKSTDGGRTWVHMGLAATGHIGRIVIDPHNPDRLFVCAIGQAYRANPERGVYRTLDGGKTWQHVLSVNGTTGCSDLAMDSHDPNTLYAGMWQLMIHTWELNSGGTDGGVYVTHDGGNTWKKLSGNGLPAANQPVGKVAVGIAATNPERVYALIEEATPSFYRSENGGKTWKLVNQSHVLAERAPYYTRFTVSTANENLLYFPSVSFSMSRDGGNTVFQPGLRVAPPGAKPEDVGLASPGGDNHNVWVDPKNPNWIIVADDGGVQVTYDGGFHYRHIRLPVAQIYHVYTDNQVPYGVYGNRQDGPSFAGPSNNIEYGSGGGGEASGGISPGDWVQAGGCESGFAIPDPQNHYVVWAGCFDGELTRMNLQTGQSRNVIPWPIGTYGWAPADVKYRWHWTVPIAISPENHNKVYVGSQVVHVTTNGGQTWKVISPDLTTNDKSHQRASGGVGTDQLMTFDGSTLFAIAESPVKAGVIWTGSNDGQVNVTEDGGAHWTNVTKNIPNLPPWGTVWSVTPSHFDAATCYIAVNFEQQGDYNAYVYKTTDYGKTWTSISAGIPKGMNSSAHRISEDPVRKGMLYLGTDNALYVSWDDGGHWTQLRNNLPPAPVYWQTIQPHFNDLAIATYGRGIWILDDITPLRNFDQAQQHSAYFFKPRPAYRWRTFDAMRASSAPRYDMGENPPYGADLNYYLKSPAKSVRITITDAKGNVVNTLKGSTEPGINRVWWNLRYSPSTLVKLRTKPPGMPWVRIGPAGWRPLVMWTGFRGAVLAAPETYTVKLDVDGQQFTQPLQVLRDPHSVGSEQDIQSETAFLLQVRNEMSNVGGMINCLEWIRRQLEGLQSLLAGNPKYADAVQAAKALEQKTISAEGNLVDTNLSGDAVGGSRAPLHEDSFRHPMRLYGNLSNLGGELDGQWGGSGSDMPPTDQEVEVNKQLQQQIAEYGHAVRELVDTAVPQFNSLLKSHGVTSGIHP